LDGPRSHRLENGGVLLHALEFGRSGPPVLLLHGLAGYAGEWSETAAWLCKEHRVIALDQRGHGASMRVPPDVTPDAFVGDAVAWLDSLDIDAVRLVGQSFGGLIAFLVAASRPDRVTRIIVAEASPSPDPGAEATVRRWLQSWTVPFTDESAALRFLGGDSARARAWVGGLEHRPDGLWPRFDEGVMLETIAASASGHWEAWDAVQCPTLTVRGEHGLALGEAQEMARRLDHAVVETVPGAGHDVHLDRPAEWRRIAEEFLRRSAA
jgi:pimeloyl-ACP methyl ester carboxylesterase